MKTIIHYILGIWMLPLFFWQLSFGNIPSLNRNSNSILRGIKKSKPSGLVVSTQSKPGTCLNNAEIEAFVQGNGKDSIIYELLQGGTVIRYYQSSNVFSNLPAGSNYIVQVYDIQNSQTAQSSALNLSTSYKAPSLVVNNTQVESCAGASDGILSVKLSGGRGPFNYSLSGRKILPIQSSNIFSGLPSGSYSITVMDSCGSSQVVDAQVLLEPNPVSSLNLCGGSAYIGYTIPNQCNSPLIVGLMNTILNGSGTPLNLYEQGLYTWAYEYPSGSGKIYGKGGVLGAAPVPVSNLSLPLVSSASYPFTYGDIIVYDPCGNKKVFTQLLYPSVPESGPGIQGAFKTTVSPIFDCSLGPGVTIQVPGTQAICYPLQYTFTDQSNGNILNFIKQSFTGSSFSFFGFQAGHVYNLVSKDGMGHRANWFNNDNISMLASAGGFSMASLQTWNNNLGYNEGNPVAVAPSAQKPGTPVYYMVKASNNSQVPIGYSDSSLFTTYGNNIALNGPNPDKTWPAGTYTISLEGSCYHSTHTFTIVGYDGKLNGLYSESPGCGSFTLGVQAHLPNSIYYGSMASSYYITILSGPGNIGKTATFNSTPLAPEVYTAFFPGLTYGTYTLGLGILGGSNNGLGIETFTYTGSNILTIDAATTQGWVCPGDSTGILRVNAHSASGSGLEYSLNNGAFQSSNTFSGLGLGTYLVKVKDGCGNIASYNASVLRASNLSLSASSNTPCLGTSLILSAEAAGAISYTWTGPNGFTSSLSSFSIPITRLELSGTYSVTVITPTCTLEGSISITVPPPPILKLINPKPVYYPSTVDITDPGLNPEASPGLVYTYYSDSLGQQIIQNPKAIQDSGTYYIKATNAQGCSTMGSVLVSINSWPMASIQYPGQAFCSRGSVRVIQSGTAGGNYSSSPGLVLDSQTGEINLSESIPGTYTVIYYFTNGLHNNSTHTQITIMQKPSQAQAGEDQVMVYDSRNIVKLEGNFPLIGTGTWTQVGGPNQAKMDNPLSDTTTVKNLIPGDYTFQWTVIHGICDSSMSQVHIKLLAPLFIQIDTLSNVHCHGESDGAISLKGSGGYGSYLYSIDRGLNFQASPSFTGLKAGNYWAMVKDIQEGSLDSLGFRITEPDSIKILTHSITLNCPETADITSPQATLGTVPGLQYTYYTDSGASQVLENPSFISQSGIYYIKGTQSGGCSGLGKILVSLIPVANPDTASVLSNHSLRLKPLVNDFGHFNVSSLNSAQPQHGKVLVNATGEILYTPEPNFAGTDLWEYSICDSTRPNPVCVHSTITVFVKPLNLPMAPKQSDLSLEMKVLEKVENDPFTYSLTIQNLGPDTATGIILTDTLPQGMVFHSTNFPNYTYYPETNIIYWNLPPLISGDQHGIIITMNAVPPGTWMNKAGVRALEWDKNLNNNKASLMTQVAGVDLFFPTLFTPNGDGINDQFIIRGLEAYPENQITIFNRWGNPVYNAQGYMQNGKSWGGDSLSDGTYYYVLSVRINGQTKKYGGYTTMIH